MTFKRSTVRFRLAPLKFILIATMTYKRPSFRRLSTVRLQVATWSPPRTETWGNVIQHSDGGGMLGMVKQDAAGLHDMCGCPLRSKRNLQERCGPWSGADMCAAFDAAHMCGRPFGSKRNLQER